jgi:hypothetical protein
MTQETDWQVVPFLERFKRNTSGSLMSTLSSAVEVTSDTPIEVVVHKVSELVPGTGLALSTVLTTQKLHRGMLKEPLRSVTNTGCTTLDVFGG